MRAAGAAAGGLTHGVANASVPRQDTAEDEEEEGRASAVRQLAIDLAEWGMSEGRQGGGAAGGEDGTAGAAGRSRGTAPTVSATATVEEHSDSGADGDVRGEGEREEEERHRLLSRADEGGGVGSAALSMDAMDAQGAGEPCCWLACLLGRLLSCCPARGVTQCTCGQPAKLPASQTASQPAGTCNLNM